MLSGVGIGVYKDVKEAVKKAQSSFDGEIKPDGSRSKRYGQLFTIYKEATEYIRDIDHSLSEKFFN